MLNEAHTRELMRARGITGRELARAVDVSESMMSYVLSGQRDVKLGTLIRIADVLSCKLDDIVIRERGPHGA